MKTTTRPATVTTVIRLPTEFASAWSPGFDLHVIGEGETTWDARNALVNNLRDLAQRLLDNADEIEQEL